MRMAFWRAKTKKASEITEGRFPVARLPAVTDEKILKGTGDDMEEVDMPAAGPPAYAVGDVLLHSDDPEENSGGSASYIKMREIYVPHGGTLRIKFDLSIVSAGVSREAYGLIYRNGSPVGTERMTELDTYTTYSEDIAGWSVGDLLQLYQKEVGVSNSLSRNFRMYAEREVYTWETVS